MYLMGCCLLQRLQLRDAALQAALAGLRLSQGLVSSRQDLLLIRQEPLLGLHNVQDFTPRCVHSV